MARLDSVSTSKGCVIWRAAKLLIARLISTSSNASSALHLVDTAVSFLLGFLHDDRPLQGRRWAVGPQHGDSLLAHSYLKFLRGNELRAAALVHKILYDLDIRHVLAGSKFRSSACHEATLAVNHVSTQAARTHFLQAPDEELQVNHATDHTHKMSVDHHRRA